MEKLYESELKVMNVLWENGDMTAARISNILKERTGWNRNTTYTVIKKCVQKGAIQRTEPRFQCHALISKEDVRQFETKELLNRMYDGAGDWLVASLFGHSHRLRPETFDKMKKLVEEEGE